LQLVHANPAASITGGDELPGKVNYFIGNDPQRWRTNLPTYSQVRYRNVYPGIDLVYYGNQSGQLEYDLVVSPGADPRAILLAIDAGGQKGSGQSAVGSGQKAVREASSAHGHTPLKIDSNGDLVIPTEVGEIRFRKPVVYQEQDPGDRRQESGIRNPKSEIQNSAIANRKFLDGSFVLDAQNRVHFALGPYDHRKPLIIDPSLALPTLSYSTFIPFPVTSGSNGIAVDSSGDVYLVGSTNVSTLPVMNSLPSFNDEFHGTDNIFIAKMNPTGTALLYSTYLGGTGTDSAGGIALDSSGDIYVTGGTTSADFPTTSGAYESSLFGSRGAFVTELNAAGSEIVYSTYLCGSYSDSGSGIAVSSTGIVYVTGSTTSINFPATAGAYQSTLAGTQNAFVAKINTANTGVNSLVYCTYLGNDYEYGASIGVDSSGNAIVAGTTYSTNFPTTPSPFQGSKGNAEEKAFVTKFNSTGAALVYSTYLGGTYNDFEGYYGYASNEVGGVAVDSAGNAYVAGYTDGWDFPTNLAYQSYYPTACTWTGFVAKFSPTGSNVYSTYMGGTNYQGSGVDSCGKISGIAVDSSGDAYVTGYTEAGNLPLMYPLQSLLAGGLTLSSATNAFVSELSPGGASAPTLLFSTYLGGTYEEEGYTIAVDNATPTPNIYVAGLTYSSGFPVIAGGYQTTQGLDYLFLAKISSLTTPAMAVTPQAVTFPAQAEHSPSSAQTVLVHDMSANPLTVSVSNSSFGGTNAADFAQTNTCTSAVSGGTDCSISVVFTPSLIGPETATLTVTGSGDAVGSPTTITLNGQGASDGVASFSSSPVNFGNQLLNTSTQQLLTLTNTGTGPLGNITISLGSGDFGESNYCQATLAPNASCSIYLTYNSYVLGYDSATLTVTDDAPNSPQTVTVEGTGVVPVAYVEESTVPSLGFGSVVVGTPMQRTVSLSNNGGYPLSISGVTITGPNASDFVVTANNCGASLGAAGYCTFSITFTPSIYGPESATFTITDNSNNLAGSIQTVTLIGTGVHVAQLSATSVNFGNQVQNVTSGPRTETFGNFGASALPITSITVSGPFGVSNTCGTSLAAQTTCNIVITYTPTSLGPQTGAVTVTYTGPNSPQTINLSGNGINAPLTGCPITFPNGGTSLVENYGHLPLSFEANAGQTDSQVKFLSRGRGYGLFLTGDEAVLKLQKAESGKQKAEASVATGIAPQTTDNGQLTTDSVLRMKLLGANTAAKVAGLDELPGKSNYFIGNDPGKWVKQAPTYAKVRYQDVYPGIDVVYYGNQGGQLEYDFVVAPGADPSAIALDVAAMSPSPNGGRRPPLQIDADGNLVLQTDGGEVVFHKPVVYQEQESGARSQESGVQDETQDSRFKIQNSRIDNRQWAIGNQQSAISNRQSAIDNRQFLDGRFVLTAENQIRFEVGPYDHSRPLVIDPALNYSTYLGGSGTDLGIGIAVDINCSAYISGQTSSVDFPLSANAPQTTFGGGTNNAFVTKLSADGTALVYSTYLGGSTDDESRMIAVDSSGDAYVTGLTQSDNFPTTSNAYQRYLYEGQAAFLSVLGPAGNTLLYSTYFGAPLEDGAVTGHQNFTAGRKAFTAHSQDVSYNGLESGFGVAVASPGYVYVTGSTASYCCFPTTEGAFQTRLNGTQNAWVAEFNTTATDDYDSLLYSTLLGGNGVDQAFGITVDSSGNVYVTGSTTSTNFPTMNAYQSALGGGGTACSPGTKAPVCGDAFVTELNSNLSGLLYSTYLGGSGEDGGVGIAVDLSGKTYVSGGTDSSNFPTSTGAFQTALKSTTSGCTNSGIACGNAFVAKLDTTQSGAASLLYSTYLGGENDDLAAGIAVDSYGDAVLAGMTNSTHFPTVNPLQSFGGGTIPCQTPNLACGDAFVAILNPTGNSLTFSTYFGGGGDDGAFSVALDSFGNSYIVGGTASTNFPATTGAFQTTFGGGVANAFAARITGAPPAVGISFSPSPVQFGNQPQGTTSAPQTLTITNIGTASSLRITNFYFSSGNPPFALASGGTCNTDGQTLLPGASCTLNFTFSPTATGVVTPGVFSFTDNASGSPQSISLTGTGTAPTAALSVTSLNFDNQVVNTTSGPRTESLANNGTGNLPITSIVASGPFSETNNCGTSVAPGSPCNITITFTPTTVGPQTGAVTINYVGVATPAVIALSGTGISAPANSCPATAVAANYGHLPLSFEANAGQTDSQVKYLSRGHGYGLFLTGDEAVLKLQKAEGGKQKAENETRKSRFENRPSRATNDQGPMTKDSVLRMKLLSANPDAKVTGSAELSGKSNYFIGNDPAKWVRNAPTYAQVRYAQVYPGIDLVYYGNQGGQLEYDFVVAPGGDPGSIHLAVETDGPMAVGAVREPPGAHRDAPLRIAANGDLVVPTDGGELVFHKPVVYQEQSTVDSQQSRVQSETQNSKLEIRNSAIDKRQSAISNHQSPITNRQFLDGHFVLAADNQIRFEVGPYDHSRPLVIDPVLVYSTYLGGSGGDVGISVAMDSSCNAYVTGLTSSIDFPTAGTPYQSALNASGATNTFISKLNSTGSLLVYSTYLGGNNDDEGYGIAVDTSGNAYVTGYATSTNFPSLHPLSSNSTLGGNSNAFVTELNPSGSALVYSTYLGGNDKNWNEYGNGIAVDSAGNVYITGETDSTNFPTKNPYQANLGGEDAINAFVSVLNWSGSALSLMYSTYLGGSVSDGADGIALDSSGNVYVAGYATSTNFPTLPANQNFSTGGAPNTSGLAGSENAFAAKLNPFASTPAQTLVYSTYLGGSGTDSANGIAVDSSGNAYVTGSTSSANFPTKNPLYMTLAGGQNAFVSALNSTGSALIYSTYLGGNNSDTGSQIAVDSSGNAYVVGYTSSTNFPKMNPLYPTLAGYTNAFVSAFNSTGSALLFSTYLGGSNYDYAYGIALDASGNAYVTGQTNSNNFPITPGAFQTSMGGGVYNAFVTMISSVSAPGVNLSSSGITFVAPQAVNSTSSSQSVTLTNNGTGTLLISSLTISGNFAFATTATSCPYTGGMIAEGNTCTIDVTFTPTAAGTFTGTVTINDNAAGSPQTVTLSGTGAAPPSITKSFGAPTVLVGGTTTLTLVITNPFTNTVALNGIAFTDTFPAGLVVATPSNLSGSCGDGNIFATAGSGSVSMNGGSASPGNNCTITLNVTGSTAGAKNNSVSVTSTTGGTGNTASATLTVGTPPTLTAAFGAASVALNGTTSLTFVVTNNSSAISITGVGFTNTLPSGLVVATPNGLTNTCGGTATATAGSSALSLSGGTVAAGATCTLAVNVQGTAAGTENDTTGTINSNEFGVGSTASASLTVVAPPVITKSFGAGSIAVNGTSSLTFTITNPSANAVLLNGIAFTDALPAGLVVATPNGVSGFCGESSLSAVAGSSTVSLSGGYLNQGTNCTLTVNVQGTVDGLKNNTVTVTSTNGGTGNTASAALTVYNPPSIAKSFGASTIAVSGVTPLTFVVTNPNVNLTVNGIGFTDTLPAGIAVATPNGVSGTCGGTITAAAGGSTVSLAGASLAASTSCTFSVNMVGTSVTAGAITNNVTVNSSNAGTGNTSTASVTVILAAGIVSPLSLTFPSDDVNNPSAAQPVTLQNISSSTLSNISLSVTGANPGDFSLGGTCGTTLGAGATCQINVTFDPTATGNRSGTLQVTYSAPGSPQTVALSGTAVAPTAQVSVTSLTYTHNLNSYPPCPSKPVIIQNNGTGPLLISSITTNNTSFTQTNTCGTSLAAGASCEIDVSFPVESPLGNYGGTLTISDNVPGSPQQTVTLSGTIYPPCPLASSNSTQQLLRTTASTTFNLSDPSPSCHTTNITMACANNAPATCVFNPPTIPPGGSTVLTVQNLDAVSTDNFSFTAQGQDSTNTSIVTLAVALADFTFTPYTATATVTAGQTASYALTLTPVNGLTGTIQLSCQGAPSGSTCSVTPATVSLAQNYPVQATVTVSTASRSMGAPRGGPPLSGPGASLRMWLELASLLALLALAAGAAAGRRARVPQPIWVYRRVRLSALALAALALMLMAWAACGGGGSATSSVVSNPGTPAGTYALTVTGTFDSTSGQATTLVRTQPLSLQVN
jgi:hypothetical protein